MVDIYSVIMWKFILVSLRLLSLSLITVSAWYVIWTNVPSKERIIRLTMLATLGTMNMASILIWFFVSGHPA